MPELTTEKWSESITANRFLLEAEIRRRARFDFGLFYRQIFSESIKAVEGSFIPGEWPDRFCERLQKGKRTCTIAARKHSKTTIILGFCAWLIYRADLQEQMVTEYIYFMFTDAVAGAKIKKLKQYIKANRHFSHIIDLKPTAETIAEYRNGGRLVSVLPAGIFGFQRSKHPDGVICDDILKDPEKKLDLEQIEKVTQIFQAQITPMPKEGGFIHLAGTAQDETDLLFKLKTTPGWEWELNPAITDWNKKKVLWPEAYSFKRLIEIQDQETGKKNFLREYQCVPVRGLEGFFTRGDLSGITDHELINHGLTPREGDPEFGDTIGGFDIGKKRHPSHLAVFEIVPENGIDYLVQVCSLWLDSTDYTDQIEILRRGEARFRIARLPYDNTRAEFEGFAERGEMPDCTEPVTMTSKNQDTMAADFEKMVNSKRLILLNDERQTRSLLSVDNNLKAPEGADGHGDAFWSIGLAIKAYLERCTAMLQ